MSSQVVGRSLAEQRALRATKNADAGEAENATRMVAVLIPSLDHGVLTMRAWAEHTPVADQVRAALDVYFQRQLNSPDLDDRIKHAKKRHRLRGIQHIDALTSDDPESVELPEPRKQEARDPDRKSISLRLDAGTFNRLTGLAFIDDGSIADQVRTAITQFLDQATPHRERYLEEMTRRRAEARSM